MLRTPTQDKALAWYIETNRLMPQLSTHPVYYFVDKHGNVTSRNIEFIVRDYKEDKKMRKKKELDR